MRDATGQQMETTQSRAPRTRGGLNWARAAIGLEFVAALTLLGLMGYKMAANAGGFGGLGERSAARRGYSRAASSPSRLSARLRTSRCGCIQESRCDSRTCGASP